MQCFHINLFCVPFSFIQYPMMSSMRSHTTPNRMTSRGRKGGSSSTWQQNLRGWASHVTNGSSLTSTETTRWITWSYDTLHLLIWNTKNFLKQEKKQKHRLCPQEIGWLFMKKIINKYLKIINWKQKRARQKKWKHGAFKKVNKLSNKSEPVQLGLDWLTVIKPWHWLNVQ